MEGWIKLHRELTNNILWASEKFTRGQAWVDMLILANHKDGYIRNKGERHPIKRGELGWSSAALAKRWGWSRTKVTAFLKELSEDDQIKVQKKDNRFTILTICNYDYFQGDQKEKRPQKDRRKTAERPQKDTNNNDKNIIGTINAHARGPKLYPQISLERDFLVFWKQYGEIGTRSKAERKYYQLRNRGVTDAEIIGGLIRYQQYIRETGTEQKYIKYAENWLADDGYKNKYRITKQAKPAKQTVKQALVEYATEESGDDWLFT